MKRRESWKQYTLLTLIFSFCAGVTYLEAALQPVVIAAPAAHVTERCDTQLKPTILVLHYTGASLGRTLKIFLGYAGRAVTSHYTISEDGIIFQHASDDVGARHAGISYWNGLTGLNSYSIGIEHINRGYKTMDNQPVGSLVAGSEYEWYAFEEEQIDASIALCKELIEKYDIHPRNIVGHADIAPKRKVDPGPLFPWKKYAEHGVGAWPDEEQSWPLHCLQEAQQKGQEYEWLTEHLSIWGYQMPDAKVSAQDIIATFQMHFRSSNIAGEVDQETTTILNNLFCTYLISKDKKCPCHHS